MNFEETCNFLFTRLANYQRQGSVAFTKNLDNTIRLAQALDNPHHKFKSIHIAGTNGKGSSASMLSSILMENGYKVGTFTSPHIKSFTERIKINGEEVSESYVIDFVTRIRPVIDEIEPSFFEITALMAFDYFAYKKVDIAVIETGLGGRLDSTNIIQPLVSLITNISMDHQSILGDSIELIAAEKAGIIKPNTPVVVSELQTEIQPVFEKKAKSISSDLYYASEEIQLRDLGVKSDVREIQFGSETIQLDLLASYQLQNLKGVLKVVEVLNKSKLFVIDQFQLKNGLKSVVRNAGLKGRYQILQEQPKVICDCGHNEEGIIQVVDQLLHEEYQNLHIVWGMSNDKDHLGIMELLPKQAKYIFCQPKIERAAKASDLLKIGQTIGLNAEVIEDVNEAVASTIEKATKHDLVFIGGSTFVLSEISVL